MGFHDVMMMLPPCMTVVCDGEIHVGLAQQHTFQHFAQISDSKTAPL
jgi:hypothetical protein